jgi:hypothetical protein
MKHEANNRMNRQIYRLTYYFLRFTYQPAVLGNKYETT